MNKTSHIVVAEAVRIEYKEDSDEVLIVFQVVDENLKKKIKKDWTQDIELKLVGKNLIEEK